MPRRVGGVSPKAAPPVERVFTQEPPIFTFVKVSMNGIVLHENVELPGPILWGLTGQESPTGPLMLQGINSPVAYRNLKITKNLCKPHAVNGGQVLGDALP